MESQVQTHGTNPQPNRRISSQRYGPVPPPNPATSRQLHTTITPRPRQSRSPGGSPRYTQPTRRQPQCQNFSTPFNRLLSAAEVAVLSPCDGFGMLSKTHTRP